MSDLLPNYQESISKEELRILNYFWLGFILYTSAFTILTTQQLGTIWKICYLIQILGLIILVPTAFLLIKMKFDNEYLKVIYSIYILWLISVVIRGFLFDIHFIMKMLFNSYEGAVIYFSPILLLFP